MTKSSPLSTGKEKSKHFDFMLDDDNFENRRPKSEIRFELLHPVLSKEWLAVPRYSQAKKKNKSFSFTLDGNDFE